MLSTASCTNSNMTSNYGDIDEHIDRLKGGGTLTENEVKNLCEKVRSTGSILFGGNDDPGKFGLAFCIFSNMLYIYTTYY